MTSAATAGQEWVVEAFGCNAEHLASLGVMHLLFEAMIRELALHPVAPPQWHRFPEPGGITGMVMLAESHLTVHTFPEHGSACINLFCCTPRAAWAWAERLRTLLGATEVGVRELVREFVREPARDGPPSRGSLSAQDAEPPAQSPSVLASGSLASRGAAGSS